MTTTATKTMTTTATTTMTTTATKAPKSMRSTWPTASPSLSTTIAATKTMTTTPQTKDHAEHGMIALHVDAEGDYGFALPHDVTMHVLKGEGHDDHDDHDDHGDEDHDDHGDEHGDEHGDGPSGLASLKWTTARTWSMQRLTATTPTQQWRRLDYNRHADRTTMHDLESGVDARLMLVVRLSKTVMINVFHCR